MFDMHAHVIYNIDDGAKDRDMTAKMLRLAAETGTRQIAATPHVIEIRRRPSWERIVAAAAELQQMAAQAQLALTVHPGAELEMNWELLELFQQGSRQYCLNGTRYLLVELPALGIPEYADAFWYELELGGIRPILAHPERNPQLMQEPARLLHWMKKGLLTQVNGGSLTGQFGSQVRENAELLVRNRMVCLLGSDAHRAEGRNTDLRQARQRLQAIAGDEAAETICVHNPRKILEDEDLAFEAPDTVKCSRAKEEKGFLRRWFGR